VSGRLKLRRGTVVSVEPLTVEVNGERRRAWADEVLLGPMREGDEVVVNVAALDLDLGSGGFDIVHVNLTSGLDGGGVEGEHAMKLNYTPLQHPVAPVETTRGRRDDMPANRREIGPSAAVRPVLVLPLHGHLAPAAWAVAQAEPRLRVGYVQTAGGALPGSFSRDVVKLRERGLLCGHITAAPAYGGGHEALSTVGAIDAAVNRLGWDAVLAGPGPGIIGSETEYGHGGVEAANSAHAALSLRLRTLISPRLSSSDPRERHVGLSHHTYTVLEMLLAAVEVAAPELGADGIADAGDALEELRGACGDRHRLSPAAADLEGYAASGLPARTMGRSLQEDPLFFAAPLAAGTVLAGVALRGKD
jgi:Protein of unknown function (DUF3866)